MLSNILGYFSEHFPGIFAQIPNHSPSFPNTTPHSQLLQGENEGHTYLENESLKKVFVSVSLYFNTPILASLLFCT